MASDAFAAGFTPSRSATHTPLGEIAFVGLLLLIFVGLRPFMPPVQVSAYGGVQEASRGDTLRQILYLAMFALVLFCAVQRHGAQLVRAVPLSLLALLAWCVASALWSAETSIVLRRAGLEVILVSSLLISVETIGAQQAFRLWRMVLAAVLVVNWISIPLIPAARHLAGEADAALVGNWRGLYGHKNIAGAVCVMTILLFLFTRSGRYNWFGVAVAAAATVFLFFTHSKTSLGFLPLALAGGGLYNLAWRDGLSRAVLATAAALLVFGLAAFALLDADAIAHTLEDPAEFTGRGAIWAAELAYIHDHPFLGSGFGTFTDTGGPSPLHDYISGSWVEAVSHGHNGYLQMLVTIGGIGFALGLISLILVPLARFWALDRRRIGFRALLFALFLFLALHNVMESDFLEGDGVNWAAFLLVLAGLRENEHDKSLTQHA